MTLPRTLADVAARMARRRAPRGPRAPRPMAPSRATVTPKRFGLADLAWAWPLVALALLCSWHALAAALAWGLRHG